VSLLTEVENISWRVLIIFPALNFLWIAFPVVYFFFPETKGLMLEDINLLFVKGGVTGGVLSSRGQIVLPHQHTREAELDAKQESTMIEDD
jgi:hypothetical protein